jgi:hypothetical protein
MVTYHQVRDVLEAALEQHGPNPSALAGAVCALVSPQHRATAHEDVYDRIRTSVWSPRCVCDLARIAWPALPTEVR